MSTPNTTQSGAPTENNRLLETVVAAVESVYTSADNNNTTLPSVYRGFQFSVPQGIVMRRRLKCTSCNHLCSPLLTVTANDCGHAHIVDHRASWQQQKALLTMQRREKAIVAEAASRKRKRPDNNDNDQAEDDSVETKCPTSHGNSDDVGQSGEPESMIDTQQPSSSVINAANANGNSNAEMCEKTNSVTDCTNQV